MDKSHRKKDIVSSFINKVLFQEEKQHITINLNHSNNYCLYSFESKDLVSISAL